MEVKKISFDWKPLLKNDFYETFRVICTIETDLAVVSGATDARLRRIEVESSILPFNDFDRVEIAEKRAFEQANDMLYYATGEECPEKPRRNRED